MDEKIEKMAKAIEYAINNDCKLNNGKSCEDCIFDNNGDWNCQNILVATHLFGEKYRKESDTAREIYKELFEKQTEVYNKYVFKNDDYDDLETNAIINFSDSLSYEFEKFFKEKYGVDLGE